MPKHVAGRGDIEEIYHGVQRSGEFIDDFSILRIGYKEVPAYFYASLTRRFSNYFTKRH
ncbi:MAG: hypothetical protein IPQ05_22265 [Leptospiraceae bacterium]|nr:hypothetical protein [Leptospiraceae bacterium]